MVGYLIGTLCLVGLIWTLRGGRHHGRRGRFRGGCGPSFYGGGCGPSFHDGGGRGFDDDRGGGGDWGYREGPPWARPGEGGPDGGGGGGRWARRGGPWGWGLRGIEGAIFRRLNATPEQEKALGEAFDGLRAAMRAAREGAYKARGELAAALRQEQVDATKLGELIAQFDASTGGVREAFTSALFKAHEVLDVRQRRELAELLEGGFFRRGGRSPWGGPGAYGAGEGGAS